MTVTGCTTGSVVRIDSVKAQNYTAQPKQMLIAYESPDSNSDEFEHEFSKLLRSCSVNPFFVLRLHAPTPDVYLNAAKAIILKYHPDTILGVKVMSVTTMGQPAYGTQWISAIKYETTLNDVKSGVVWKSLSVLYPFIGKPGNPLATPGYAMAHAQFATLVKDGIVQNCPPLQEIFEPLRASEK